jgi:hypothetical protein
MKLYYAKVLNPRKACVVAKCLNAPEFPEIERWHKRLSELPAWLDPFPTVRAAA